MTIPDQREESLGEFLASRARRASDTRLAWDAIAASLMAIAVFAWGGPAWDVRLSIAVGLLSYGIWGVADRDLARNAASPRRVRRALKTARVVATVFGFLAGAYLMMAVLARALGRIIS